MSDFKIYHDGSVRYLGHTLTPDQASSLADWLGELLSTEAVAGFDVRIDRVSIGCQAINYTTLLAFAQEYNSREWETTTYRAGQMFRKESDGEVYVLAQTSHNHVALISLRSGNRWNEPVPVEDVNKVFLEEVNSDSAYEFTPIERRVI